MLISVHSVDIYVSKRTKNLIIAPFILKFEVALNNLFAQKYGENTIMVKLSMGFQPHSLSILV